jgi:lipid-A-disaccharide synthase
VRAPFLSMVNLVAARAIVPELIQRDMQPERLAQEALLLLSDAPRRDRMRAELGRVRDLLVSVEDPMDRAVQVVETVLNNKETVNAR